MSSNNDSFAEKVLSIISKKSAIGRRLIDEGFNEALEPLIQKIEHFESQTESQTKAKLKELEQKNKALINQNTQLKENNRHLKAQNQKLKTKIKGLSKWEMISK